MSITMKFPIQRGEITAEVLKKFLEAEEFKGDRKFYPKRAESLLRDWENNVILNIDWKVAIVQGRIIRMNGLHTSTNLKNNPDILTSKVFPYTLQEYVCDTMEDVAMLFSRIDAKSSARTAFEIYEANSSIIAELEGIEPAIIRTVISGISMYHKDIYAIDPHTRAARLNNVESVAFAKMYNELWLSSTLGKGKNPLSNMGITRAVYETFLLDKEGTKEFWAMVMSGSHPLQTHPTRILREALISHIVNGIRGAGQHPNGKERANYYVMANWSIMCWNAWQSGEKLKRIPNKPKNADKTHATKFNVPKIIVKTKEERDNVWDSYVTEELNLSHAA